MADREVESILREIREGVLSQQRAVSDKSSATHSSVTNGGYGSTQPVATQQIANNDDSLTAANLALIQSYLTTTARAWDRLPPLLSNRSGFISRVELWLKRQIKRATHWFTWEQVNFNAATHHALRDLLPVLSMQQQAIEMLRAQLAAAEAQRTALEQSLTDLAAHMTSLPSELREELRTEIDSQARVHEVRNSQVDARFAELSDELREREEGLLEEQRVCFKQLSLQTSEAAVLEDRARRKTEALLEALQQRVARIEKGRGD